MSLTDEERAQLAAKLKAGRGRGRASRVPPELLAKEYLSGKPVKEIALETGLHPQTIYGHLQRLRDEK